MKTKNLQIKTLNTIKNNLFLSINNIFSSTNNTTIIVPHVCNNIDLFGGGFTGDIINHYPIVKDNYHMLGKYFLQKNLGYTQFVTAKEDNKNKNKIVFANMIAQNGIFSLKNKRPLNYLALCKSMVAVGQYAKDEKKNERIVQIHAPKFGSGLAKGNWHFIANLIEDIWADLPMFIYEFDRRS
jgi:hypothetical protein